MRTRSAARAGPGGTRTAAPGQGDIPPTVAQTFEPPHACRGAAMAETVFDFF